MADRLWPALIAASSTLIWSPPTPAQQETFEQASAAFVQRYLAEWSSQTPAALSYMDQLYPDRIDFYGRELSHDALMNLKRKFATRWPERSLRVRPDSIRVRCNPSHLCSVQAVYDWQYRSPDRAAASSGTANLKLELQDGMTIVAEDGSVIPSNGATPPALVQQAPRSPTAPPPEATAKAPVAPEPAAPPETAKAPEPPPQVAKAQEPPPGVAKATEPPPSKAKAQEAAPTPPAAPFAEARPQQDQPGPAPEEEGPELRDTVPKPADIAALRNAYQTHGGDKAWITTWLAQKRDFRGEAIFVGATEDQAAPGSAGVVRTVDFNSAAGTVACINPKGATSLKPGEKVNLHGVITIFIEDVMYLGQCSIQPG